MKKKETQISYENYQKLICMLAWWWSVSSGWDFQELKSEGNLRFVQILPKFDPSESEFSTFLFVSINQHFRNLVGGKIRRHWKEREVVSSDLVEDELDRSQLESLILSPDRRAALKEAIGQLGHDARLLVECVLETPCDLLWMFGGRGKGVRINKHVLQQYFVQKKGWTIGQCWKAFSEIREALNAL